MNQVDVDTDSFCSPDITVAGADLAMAVEGSAAVRAWPSSNSERGFLGNRRIKNAISLRTQGKNTTKVYNYPSAKTQHTPRN